MARNPEPLPVDDPRWVPLAAAHKRRWDITGDMTLAASDLTAAARKGVRTMRRGTDPQSCELLSVEFWNDHVVRVYVNILNPSALRRVCITTVGAEDADPDLYYFFWLDDLEKLWPIAQSPTRHDLLPNRRGRVVTHDWFAICGEIARRCIDSSGRVKVPKSETRLAKDVAGWLQEQGKNDPADSEMRAAVKQICAALRRAQK
jgi:hypothetical protein